MSGRLKNTTSVCTAARRAELQPQSPQRGKKSKPASTIITGDYKLHYWWETGDIQLFNLSKDLSETTDLAKSHPKRAASLKKELFSYLKDIDAQLPPVNDDYDPATDPARLKGANRK